MSEESSQEEEVPVEEGSQESVKVEKPVCPTTPKHVQLYQDCCDKFEKGEMTDIDVMEHVIGTLKKIRKTE